MLPKDLAAHTGTGFKMGVESDNPVLHCSRHLHAAVGGGRILSPVPLGSRTAANPAATKIKTIKRDPSQIGIYRMIAV